ncbi:MAG: zinc-binding alcohol dehydrogenase [Candidatus Poribacteria bacterium]
MRALVTMLRDDGLREKRLVDDWPEPDSPTGSQVRTRVLFSGVTNGTERNDLIGGNYARPTDALPGGCGYQNVGEVIEIGPDVEDLAVGDLLCMSQDHLEFCLENEDGLHIKLPDDVEPEHAALFGVGGVAMRCCRNADLRMGDQFLVVGAGIVGQLAAQIANAMGARVTLCDVDERRLTVAREIGAAEEVVDVAGEQWAGQIPDAGFRAVLDVAGVSGMEDNLIRAAEHGGSVLFIAGRHKVEYTFNLAQGREITIKQNSHFDRSDLDNLCRLVRRRQVKFAPIIQDVVPISEAARVYDTLRDEPALLLGTVFDWR